MRVSVDPAVCTGHAQCHAYGPEVYDLDDEGYCVIRSADVPPELEKQAEAGASVCPEGAITIER